MKIIDDIIWDWKDIYKTSPMNACWLLFLLLILLTSITASAYASKKAEIPPDDGMIHRVIYPDDTPDYCREVQIKTDYMPADRDALFKKKIGNYEILDRVTVICKSHPGSYFTNFLYADKK